MTDKAKPKAPTAKRQAAIDAYKAAHGGRAPPARMSAKAMNEKAIIAGIADRRQAQRRAQVDALWGSGKGIDPVTGTKAPTTASTAPSTPHKPVWNDVRAKGSAGPAIAMASAGQKVGQAYNTFNRFATPVATGVMAAQQFRVAKARGASNGQAAGEAAAVAAPGALAMAARPVGTALSSFGSSAMSLGGALLGAAAETVGGLGVLMPALNTAYIPGMVAGGVGVVAKVAGEGLKVAGRVAAPAMAAYGAYRGAQADGNKVRGAVRGAIGALDPSGIVTNVGAATGLMSDHRGLGERAFDAAFGKASAPGQASNSFNVGRFAAANSKFEQGRPSGGSGDSGQRNGWSNEARAGAYVARMTNAGKAAENIPYGLPVPEARR